jgi:putative transposase
VDLFHREWMEFKLARSISHRDVFALVDRIRQGKAVRIRTDNGGQFVAEDLARSLQAIGVEHEFIRPATPQQNAHVESFHAVLASALLNRFEFRDEDDAREHLVAFRAFYNHERVHSATCYYPPLTFLGKWRQGLVAERTDSRNRRVFLRAKGTEAPRASEAVVGVTQ